MNENIEELGGTFIELPIDDFYKNQTNNIDSFGLCPGCDKETLNIESRICGCGYNLNHKTIKNIKIESSKKVQITVENICSCGMKKNKGSRMCKECFDRNAINKNY